MTDLSAETRILFPLRTNVEVFQTPEGYLALEERIKIAALLYDKVVLEGGFYELTVSQSGSFELRTKRGTEGNGISDDDAAHRRSEMEALLRNEQLPPFFVGVQPSDGSSSVTPIVGGRMQELYFAEFQSLAATAQLKHQHWVEWLDNDFASYGSYAAQVQRNLWNDERMEIGAEIENPFLRSTLLKALNHDLLTTAAINATLSADPLHSALMERKMIKSGFAPSLRLLVVQTSLPSVRSVPWDEVIDLRSDPGMIEFRRVIREIEAEALASVDGATIEDIRNRIQIEWNERMADTLASNRSSLREVATGTAESVLLDLINVPVPFLGTAIGLARDLNALKETRKSWLSVFMRLARSNSG